MIRVKELQLRNFLSHVDTSIDFLDYEGLTLIEGVTSDGRYSSNGAGKSTILEGVLYALKGTTLRNVSADGVINRNVGKDMRVSIGFSLVDGNYVVQRYRKDTVEGTKIKLFKNTEDISSRLDKSTQATLDDILDIDQKVLLSTMLLGEGLSSRFTQLSDPDKKALLESTLNLAYSIPDARKSANTKIKQLKEESAGLQGQLSVLERFLSVDAESQRDRIPEMKEIISKSEQRLSEINEDMRVNRESHSIIVQKLTLLSNTIQEIERLHQDLTKVRDQIDHISLEKVKVETGETTICSLCGQHLSSQSSVAHISQTYTGQLNDLSDTMQRLKLKIMEYPGLNTLVEKRDALYTEMQFLDNHHADYTRESQSLVAVIQRTKSDLENLEMSLANHESYSNESKELSGKLESNKRATEVYEYLSNMFSPTGLQTMILSEAITYINQRIKVYSDILMDKSYSIEFKKGKIDLVDSAGSTYQSLSNGEKRRLDICIQFSLHDYVSQYCGIGLDSLFIDEILDTLDTVGVSNIIEVLRLKMDYCKLKRIFVITHNNDLKGSFDSVLTVVKDIDGNSRIKN